MMYTGSSDHTARAWVTEFGDCTRVFKGHKHSVAVVKFREGLRKFHYIYVNTSC
jgi:WD40 repeat protein